MSNDVRSTEGFDKKRLAELGRLAVGNRSISDFVQETGLSRAFVSRLLNAKLAAPPKHDTLYRFAGPEAHPQGNVTAEDLIAVCGAEVPEPPAAHTPARNISEADVVASYYAPRPTMALSLFLDVLAERDLSQEYRIGWMPGGAAQIETPDERKKALILSAFCVEPKAEEAIVVSVLQRIFLLADHSSNEMPIYIMTETKSMYKKLCEALWPLSTKMKLSVLCSTEDYLHIVRQKNMPDGAELPFSLAEDA